MSNPPRKKLIEVSIPLEAINKASAREKSIRHGHPSTLHLWWARRPLAACRAVLFAQLVDDPSAWPEKFPTVAEQEKERLRLHRVIERMVPWEASNDEAILNEARWEIARSVAWGLGEEPPEKGDGESILAFLQEKAPPVYDPFSGGGSIPLEAQRLGLRAYGSDLNPVAVLIGKALVEIPPKFAGLPPVNPSARTELKHGHWNAKGAQGLAEDVRYYGQWMRDEAQKRIGHLYPKVTLADGSPANVIAWLWARTVRSPDPAAKGAMVPLVSSFMLSTKEGKKAWVDPVIDITSTHGWRFDVKMGALSKSDEETKKRGTKNGRAFTCLLTGSSIDLEYIRRESKSTKLGQTLLALVVEGPRGRLYITPDNYSTQVAAQAEPTWGPEELVTTPNHDVDRLPMYGMPRWRDAFTPRQLVGLTTFSELVSEVRERVIGDASTMSFVGTSDGRLADGANGPSAYADAVATYLGLAVGRSANRASTICIWNQIGEKIEQVFKRQAIPITWDFAEGNLLGTATGSFIEGGVGWITEVLAALPTGGTAAVTQIDAAKNSYPVRPVVISTDPPYYDNIGYADLSDFFYVWLRPTLEKVWPSLLRRLVTPKDEELVASYSRYGSKANAEKRFMDGMGEALTAIHHAATDAEPLAIYYAYKQSEASDDGATSAGWSSFLQAVVDAELAVDGTWPVRTERSGGIRDHNANALASSIVLVCRKRNKDASTIDRAGFTVALRRELPDAIAKIRVAGVGPVDMQQSVIGPGMGVFTRYSEVLDDDDKPLPVKTALAIINRVWQEIDSELVASFDSPTQVALAWFGSYQFDARASGELITLANAKNTSIDALFDSEVFRNLHGKASLTPRDELPATWSPANDKNLTVWECVQHTSRVLNSSGGGAVAAGRLVAEMGTRAADARALLDRLFQIATEKGWTQEALVYNQLAEEWPHLLEQAANYSSGATFPTTTGDLFA